LSWSGFHNTHAALADALATVFVLVELVKIARRHCPEAIEDSCFRAIDVCNHAAGKRAEHQAKQAKVAKTSKTSKSKPLLKQGGAKRSVTQTARQYRRKAARCHVTTSAGALSASSPPPFLKDGVFFRQCIYDVARGPAAAEPHPMAAVAEGQQVV
jgi:hypothetical protein